MNKELLALPETFCWTRFGTESGEGIGEIVARKEAERQAAGGVFLWGVGNSIGPSVHLLGEAPVAVFSPIVSAPRACDAAPPRVVRWQRAVGFDGEQFPLPASASVVSRETPTRRAHFALVCQSDTPLRLREDIGELCFDRLRNLASGRPLGASQVTAAVRLVRHAQANGRLYPIAMIVHLAPPYFVRLFDPVIVTDRDHWEINLSNTRACNALPLPPVEDRLHDVRLEQRQA